jgi:hypothetical protein
VAIHDFYAFKVMRTVVAARPVYGVRPHGAKRAQIGHPPHTSRLKLLCLLALPWKSQGSHAVYLQRSRDARHGLPRCARNDESNSN